jgi:hypothetical protein
MTWTAPSWLTRGLSAAAAGAPFAFALIRAARTGDDFRYFWVAAAAFVGGLLATAVGKPYARTAPALFGLILVVATTFAVAAALLIGTVLGPGILVVGLSFGLCFAVSSVLGATVNRVADPAGKKR